MGAAVAPETDARVEKLSKLLSCEYYY